MFLSTIAAKLLNLVIDKRESRVIDFVMKVPIVSIGIAATIFTAILAIVPAIPLEAKLLFVSSVVLFNMWVFLMETIKTHLVNTLPEEVG